MAANQTSTVFGKIAPEYKLKSPKSQRQTVLGLSFPLGSNLGGGYFSKSSGINMIKGAVKQLLLTEPGERIMLPNFGCNLKKYLFEPIDEITFESIKREIEFSFNNYIKGAILTKIAVIPTGDSGPSGGNSLEIILSVQLSPDELEIFDVEVVIA